MIGLIGGLGVGAAIHYYRGLASAHEKARRPLELSMAHASISRATALATAGDRAGLAEYLAGFLARLKAIGATIGVVPAVTPHICKDELKAISPLPLVDITVVVSDQIRERQLSRVALFGTRFVMDSDLYGALNGVEVVHAKEDEREFVHDAYTRLAHTGIVNASERDRLIALAHTLQRRDGVQAVVLAGTDFAVMFDASNTPFPHVDCARAHIDAIVRAEQAN